MNGFSHWTASTFTSCHLMTEPGMITRLKQAHSTFRKWLNVNSHARFWVTSKSVLWRRRLMCRNGMIWRQEVAVKRRRLFKNWMGFLTVTGWTRIHRGGSRGFIYLLFIWSYLIYSGLFIQIEFWERESSCYCLSLIRYYWALPTTIQNRLPVNIISIYNQVCRLCWMANTRMNTSEGLE